ncbi:MAG: DUF2617 family protein [Mycobacterium sp.]|nr:MAG: DUF2617 family protein [Mycobacterium sp.]
MPLHHLAVAPADVSGARLALALNAAAPPTLASYRLEHPRGGALVLGVLGASHVVTVQHGTGEFSEQVSCSAGDGLPAQSDAPGYHLESHSATHDEAAFRALARDLRQRCAREPGWLGGVFPGDDAALTALGAEPDGDGWQWQTWHLYPTGAGGTVVYTASRWHP